MSAPVTDATSESVVAARSAAVAPAADELAQARAQAIAYQNQHANDMILQRLSAPAPDTVIAQAQAPEADQPIAGAP